MDEHHWHPFDEGQTSGTTGSEGGVILLDEEYDQGARITLEQCHFPPYAITCGLYGWMVHTTFAGSKDEAFAKLEAMKLKLADIYQIISNVDDLELEAKIKKVTAAIKTLVEEF